MPSITETTQKNILLRIFSFIPQGQRIQPNFMNHTYQTTKQTNTTRTTKTITSVWVSPLTQSYANSEVFIFKFCNKSTNFIHFTHHQLVHFINPPKTCTWLDEQFCTFHLSLNESVTTFHPSLHESVTLEHTTT